MNNKRWITSIVYIALGVGLLGCGIAQILDEFWSGMGGGLLGVGLVRMIQMIRYQKNETYKEAVDTARSDERNRFIANKAWAWAGYWYVLIGAVGTLVFRLVGMEELSVFCGSSICLILVLYWVSYLWLRKKY